MSVSALTGQKSVQIIPLTNLDMVNHTFATSLAHLILVRRLAENQAILNWLEQPEEEEEEEEEEEGEEEEEEDKDEED